MKKSHLATLLIALAGALYGCLGFFGTLVIREGISVSSMLFWRFLTATVFLLALGLKDVREASWKDLRTSAVPALLYCLSTGTYFLSSRTIGTGLGMVIFFTYPVFIYLGLFFLMKEPITRQSWAALIVVAIGFTILNINLDTTLLGFEGVLFGMVSSLTWAAYMIISKRQSRRINPMLTSFCLCAACSLYFLASTPMEGTLSIPRSPYCWLLILALGILPTSLPILLMLKGLKSISADRAGVLAVLEPVFTVFVGILFLHETLTFTQMVGIAIILGGATGAGLGAAEG